MDHVDHDLTAEQWTALQEAWGGCAYCDASDQPLQRDCVQALSRGGRYNPSATLYLPAPRATPANRTTR